ncbi:hypothetical protein [Sphingomonas azotifigens]|uniref:hypothetical protein n=1 Tax=Sphingomonas azotifigens TaxID=330920 RepID=UPI000A03A9FC|nr:hypothetical protein [Sphingomonas azotifigens]
MTFPRQPAQLVITPSNQSPWVGWPNSPGDRFTRAQVSAMKRNGIDPETHAVFVTVFREATTREMYWPRGDAPPVFQFDCPVLSTTSDGRLRVIAPSGDVKIVLRNGWVKEPSYLNQHLLDRKDA